MPPTPPAINSAQQPYSPPQPRPQYESTVRGGEADLYGIGVGGPPPLPEGLPYRAKKAVLTQGERAFYDVLRHVCGDACTIFVNVRLADLLIVTASRNRQSSLARIIQKSVDFVLCDPTTLQPVLLIELDDRTHDREDRAKRDAFLDEVCRAAGLRLLRVQAQRAYDVEELRRQLAPVLWS